MDIASLAGLILGVAMCILGIVTSGGVEAFGNFVDIPSVFVTIGGSLSSVLSSLKLSDFINGFKSISLPFQEKVVDPAQVMDVRKGFLR